MANVKLEVSRYSVILGKVSIGVCVPADAGWVFLCRKPSVITKGTTPEDAVSAAGMEVQKDV